MFPGADTRGGVARGLAALSTGIRRQGVDHQIPSSNPYRSNLPQRPNGIQMPYPTLEQQHRQFASAKRSFTEMQQLQSLQASTLARSVRQRIAMAGSSQVIPIQQQQNQFNYLSFQHPNNQLNQLQQEQLHLMQNRQPIPRQQYQQQMLQNHFFGSLADSSTLSGSSSVSGVTTNAPANLALSANPNRAHQHHQPENNTAAGDASASRRQQQQQQQLEFAKVNGFFPCTATSSSGCEGMSELTQSDCGNGNGTGSGNRNRSSSGTTLEYLEHCLLDDDDDDDDLFSMSEPANASGSEAAANNGHIDWTGTMEDILALTEPPPPAKQPESISGSESSLTLDEVLAMTVPSPPPPQQQSVPAQPSVSACASVTASASTPAAATPPPSSPLQHQQQQNKSPLSPSTPSSSASSSFNPAQPVSPAPPPIPTQQLLSEAAAAIADGNMEQASSVLSEVKKTLAAATTKNPAAASDPVEQRLLGYFADALLSRINPAEGGDQMAAASLQNQNQGQSPVPDLCSVEHMCDVQRLQEIGLFYRMSISAANLAILESVLGLPRIHIIDFDISGGSQYAALLNSVYTRYRSQVPPTASGGPPLPALPLIKITAVVDPRNPYSANTACPDRLRATGASLAKQAKAMGFGFEFRTVRLTPSELTRSALGCSSEDPEVEPLIVNFGFVLSKLADESVTPLNPRDELLRCVKSLSPRLVTVVEQEMNCNTAPFLNRFRELSAYYAAAFEAVRAHLSSNVDARVVAQAEAALGRKAANAVAAEGWRRVERCEVLGKWRARFGMAGFKPNPIGRGVIDTIQKFVVGMGQQQLNGTGNGGPAAGGVNKKSNVSVNVGVEEEGGGVVFGWKGRRLTAVSAWRC